LNITGFSRPDWIEISLMPQDTPQIELWSHIQTERLDAFEGAKTRLDSLIRRAEKLTRRRNLLNIGCGNGYLEARAQSRQWQVVSVDPDQKSVNRISSMGIDARCGSITSLPVPAASIDVVICTEVFEHLTQETLELGLKEIQRVLIPGGILIGTVPYRENLQDNEVFCPHCSRTFHRWGHHQSFDEVKMRGVLEREFHLRMVKPVYFPQWNQGGWKGKLLWSARWAFGMVGVYGSSANLFFSAANDKTINN
jgi:SAM-dependent methyltransferase